MHIDLLYFKGCPSWQQGLKNLKSALEAEGLTADINLILVADDEQAAGLKFLGSPSFRSDGKDWWPDERDSYNLSCRVYITPQGMRGVPTVEMLRQQVVLHHQGFK
jgi:hypothetical protein